MTDEEARLEELRRYDVLDSEQEPAFDRIAELAALASSAPIALITFLDENRQWCKAQFGVDMPDIERRHAFCDQTIRLDQNLIVEDATRDDRFAALPLVTGEAGIRFYAGAPLTTPHGLSLGALCVLDRRPRALDATAERALTLLRDSVMQMLEMRRERLDLRNSESLREEAVEALLATKIDLERRVELRTREVDAAHRRLQEILARVADGFVALDREWRYTYVNERGAQMFDQEPAHLIGKLIWNGFPRGGVDHPFKRACEQAIRDQVPVTLIDYYQPGDRWFEDRIYPSPDGVSVFFTEITEKRRAEQLLKESEQRLLEAQAVAHVGSWEWSVATNRVMWSAEMFKIYGITKEQFVGSYEGFLSRVYADDLEITKAVIGRAYQHPGPFVYDHRIVRPDGTLRMLHTRGDVITDEAGQVVRMVGSCWDTTDRG